jgi:transposase
MYMSAEDQLKIDVIAKVRSGLFTQQQATAILAVGDRTIRRYLKCFGEKGILFFQHGNRGKSSHNKTEDEIKKSVFNLVQNKYFDFNMLHCLEKLALEGIEIKRETFRKWCHEWNLVKRKKKRRSSKARYLRSRMKKTGVLLQMDGSPHKWFDHKDSCLIGAIDDADSEVVYAEFFKSESTLSCMTVLQKIIEKKGIFDILYVDKAGIFGGGKRSNFSQVKRALSELGIQIIFADSAQAKGRIERLWDTMQDRLIPEMRFRDIRGFHNANEFLHKVYLPEHNSKFKVVPGSLDSSYRQVPKDIDLSQIFCIKEIRKIANDHTISWNGSFYLIKSPSGYSLARQSVELRTYQDESWKAFYAGKELEIKMVTKNTPAQIKKAA